MKTLKKHLCALFAALTALTLLLTGACANSENSGKIQIVCTIFPQYDWVRELTDGAENVEVTLLEDSGADLHNFQPSAADKVAILNADLFVYIGGESDEWAKTLLKNADREVRSLDLLDALGDRALTEEEGIEESSEHDHEHEDEADEHIWLSVQNAKVLVSAISEALCGVDEGNAALYRENCENYLIELDKLDEAFEKTVSSAKRTVLVFADRYPFRYLAHDYGLTCYAAFSGCSAESEASFATILALVRHVEENSLPYVMVLESSTQGIAKQVIDNTESKDQGILVLNSLQSVTREDIGNGATYLDLMKEDLAVLKTALN